jgi:hypothetical protein
MEHLNKRKDMQERMLAAKALQALSVGPPIQPAVDGNVATQESTGSDLSEGNSWESDVKTLSGEEAFPVGVDRDVEMPPKKAKPEEVEREQDLREQRQPIVEGIRTREDRDHTEEEWQDWDAELKIMDTAGLSRTELLVNTAKFWKFRRDMFHSAYVDMELRHMRGQRKVAHARQEIQKVRGRERGLKAEIDRLERMVKWTENEASKAQTGLRMHEDRMARVIQAERDDWERTRDDMEARIKWLEREVAKSLSSAKVEEYKKAMVSDQPVLLTFPEDLADVTPYQSPVLDIIFDL